MRHGEAISVGMTFAAALGHSAGVTSAELVARQAELLGKLGLPTTYRGGGFDEIREITKLDKKAQASRLRFIVLREVGQVEVLDDPSEGLLLQAWQQIQDVA
jgi:3-dehydroquinate synthase